MKKNIFKKYVIGSLVISFISITIPFIASAKQTQAQSGSGTTQGTTNNSSTISQGQSSGSDSSQSVQTQSGKLTANNLEKCQNREMTISSIMARVVDRGEKQLLLMDAVYSRLQNFYESNNYQLENYNDLINAVNAERVAAQNMVQTVAQNGKSFDCGNDDPKGVASTFQERAKAQNGSLNSYKTALKNLLDGIKTAAGVN